MRATVRLISNNRVTIPPPVRDALDVEEGDFVEIDVQPVETSGRGT